MLNESQKSEILKTVKRAFDGAFTPMMQFLLDNNNLSQKQLNELEDLVRKKRIQESAAGKN